MSKKLRCLRPLISGVWVYHAAMDDPTELGNSDWWQDFKDKLLPGDIVLVATHNSDGKTGAACIVTIVAKSPETGEIFMAGLTPMAGAAKPGEVPEGARVVQHEASGVEDLSPFERMLAAHLGPQ